MQLSFVPQSGVAFAGCQGRRLSVKFNDMRGVAERGLPFSMWSVPNLTQRRRARGLLLIEPRPRRVTGYRHLPRLAAALRRADKT